MNVVDYVLVMQAPSLVSKHGQLTTWLNEYNICTVVISINITVYIYWYDTAIM